MSNLREILSQRSDQRLALLGIPLDHNSSFMRGPAEAPPRIRDALRSDSTNMWSESGINLGAADALLDAGDLSFESPAAAFDEITGATRLILQNNLKPLLLGGDHSISFPILRAIAEKHKNLTLLQFDAHPDLYDEFEGSRESHACPFARIMENGLADRLIQVGIRGLNRHQREQAKRFGVEIIEMKDWRDDWSPKIEGSLYLSFDMDALDPACAPGISHWEPGGLNTRQVVNALHRLEADIVGADIVEYNPRRDPTGVTACVVAKLLKEIAAKMMAGPG